MKAIKTPADKKKGTPNMRADMLPQGEDPVDVVKKYPYRVQPN